MMPLYTTQISTIYGNKEIAVYACDITKFHKDIDILTTSAYVNSYHPSPRTLFKALHDIGIYVNNLARNPAIDLRQPCHTWLSEEISVPSSRIRRIGCIELIGRQQYSYDYSKIEQSMLNSIRAYFSMLDIAAIYGIKMDTVVLPLLGSGRQHLAANLIIVPLLNECIAFLKRNSAVKRIYFVERAEEKALFIADYIQKSYNILASNTETGQNTAEDQQLTAFISYASPDKNIADNLCAKLESRGVRVWYAPRDVQGPYAAAITQAIDKCTHFIVILSQNSMMSQHVLNEVDLAFQRLPNNVKFKPLRIDESLFTPSFKYYLSRQHWMDAIIPPLETRLNEFVDKLLSDV